MHIDIHRLGTARALLFTDRLSYQIPNTCYKDQVKNDFSNLDQLL